MYIVRSRQLTPRTPVYDVLYEEDFRFVAQFGKMETAEKFAKYLEDNEVFTLGVWQKQPWKVRLAFCLSTTAYFPNLK